MIRTATEFDALVALQMGEAYVQETGHYVDIPYDANLAVGNMLLAIHDPRQLFLIAVDSSGEAVGMLWAFCGPALPWSPAPVAVDQIVYVDPKKRGSKHGIELIQEYEKWAVNMGAVEVRLSIASGIHEDKSGKLYEKLGYDRLGSQFRRRYKYVDDVT